MKKYLPSRATRKAVVAAVVTAAAYIVGVIDLEAGLVDALAGMTGAEWLGLVVFLGGSYLGTYAVKNLDTPEHPVVAHSVADERGLSEVSLALALSAAALVVALFVLLGR